MDGQLFRVPQIRRTCKQTPGALDQRRDNLHLSVLYFCCLGQGLGTKVIRRVRSVSLSQRCIGRFWPWKWPRVCGRLWQATSIRCVTKGQSKSTTLSSGNHLLRRYNLAGQTEWQGLFNFSTFGKEVMALARYSSRPWMMRQIGTGISEGVGEMESEMKAALFANLTNRASISPTLQMVDVFAQFAQSSIETGARQIVVIRGAVTVLFLPFDERRVNRYRVATLTISQLKGQSANNSPFSSGISSLRRFWSDQDNLHDVQVWPSTRVDSKRR